MLICMSIAKLNAHNEKILLHLTCHFIKVRLYCQKIFCLQIEKRNAYSLFR